jgi:hypothetical protein
MQMYKSSKSESMAQGSTESRTASSRMTASHLAQGFLLAGVAIPLAACGGGPYRAYYYEDDHHYRFYESKSGDVLLVSPHGQIAAATSVVRKAGYPSLQDPNNHAPDLGDRQTPLRMDPTISGSSTSTWLPWTAQEHGNAQVIWNSGSRPDPSAPKVSTPKWFPWGNWPLSPPQGGPILGQDPSDVHPTSTIIPIAGLTTWKSDIGDWDMDRYDVAPTTGSCRPYPISITMNAMYPAPHDPFFKKRSCWNALWDVPASIATDALVGAGFVLAGAVFAFQVGALLPGY